MAKLVAALCPTCGAGVKIDASRDHVTCAYCGTSSFIRREKPAPTAPSRERPAPIAPSPRPQEPVIYVDPPSKHGVLLAVVVVGFGMLAGGTFAYAVANADTPPSKSAAPAQVKAPPEGSDRPRVKLETPHVESGPAIQDADQVIGGMRAGIQDCYERALGTRKRLRGDFSLQIEVTQSSTEIGVMSSELPPEVLDCMQNAVRLYSFAPQQNSTLLRVHGTLIPPDPPPCGCAPDDPLCTCH